MKEERGRWGSAEGKGHSIECLRGTQHDRIKGRFPQGYSCLSQCGQHRAEGWKPDDRRLRGEQVITKLEFMDFPLDKRKNRMEAERGN